MGKGSKKKAMVKRWDGDGKPTKKSKGNATASTRHPPPQDKGPSDADLLELYRMKLFELAKSHAALLKKVELDASRGGNDQNDLISFSQLSETSPPSSPFSPEVKAQPQAHASNLFSSQGTSFVNEMDNWLQVHDANSRLSLASSMGDTPSLSQNTVAASSSKNNSNSTSVPPPLPPAPPPSLPLTPNVRVGVGVVIKKKSGKKVHAGIRKGSHGTGTLALPGGHLEFGETWETCAIREVEEECGIDISSCPLKLIHVTNDPMISENKHYITLFMGCVVDDDVKFVNAEPHKCEGWEEHTLEELDSSGNLFGPLMRLIDQKPKSFTNFLEGGD